MSDLYKNSREARNANFYPGQGIPLSEQRKKQYINNLQGPIAEIIDRTIALNEIDFNDEEWLRNIIRSYPVLEKIYQGIKSNIAYAVSSEHFGDNIERSLLEQEFTAMINAPDMDAYSIKLTAAVEKFLGGQTIENRYDAQRAYDSLNQCREQITDIIASNNKSK